jgi:CheY-like chemotaxis protein
MNASENAQIVIVEDNAADVLLIRKALDEKGFSYILTRFEDGEEALHALCPDTGESSIDAPDVIVLDLNVPRCEGIDLLRQIRETPRLHDVPVAILTSSESPLDKRRAEDFGADRYILKPAELDAFFAEVGGEIKELLAESERRRHKAAAQKA